jgi:hypothetical protein
LVAVRDGFRSSPPLAASRTVSNDALVDEAAADAASQRRSAAGLRMATPASSGMSRSTTRST